MVRALVVGSLLWPIVLAATTVARAHEVLPGATTAVYLSTSRICHQRPERSFFWRQAQWPVCGRCAGLYLAAPVGAVLAAVRRRGLTRRATALALAVAAAPTAVTFGLEWFALAPISSLDRFLTALPLGAVVAGVIVVTASRRPESIG